MDKKVDRKESKATDLRDPYEFKKFLGEAGEGYTDRQLRRLQEEMFNLAGLLLDLYRFRHSNEDGKDKYFDSSKTRDYDEHGQASWASLNGSTSRCLH